MKQHKIGEYTYTTKKQKTELGDYFIKKSDDGKVLVPAIGDEVGKKRKVIIETDDPEFNLGKEVLTETITVQKDPDDISDQTGLVKVLSDTNELLLLKCPNCGSVHFRHAGYVHPLTRMAYQNFKEIENHISSTQLPVQICVSCKTSVVDHGGKLYNISEHIDLEAWEKTEKEAHKATGPGGQC